MTGTGANIPHHRVEGSGDAPPLILGPSLGTSLRVWDAQASTLARHHRVIRWDLPGHGGSPTGLLPSTAPGATTIADLGRIVLGLADSLGVDRFHYAGISIGGAVGTWLAVHHPKRIASLALVCSSARFGEPSSWHERAALVRSEASTGVLAEATAGRWFTPDFAGSPAARALIDDLRAADPEGYAACCDALSQCDLRADLPRITAPTLVIAGRDDPATPPAHARELADGIPGASLTEVAHAAHQAATERPAPVLAALLAHLAAAEPHGVPTEDRRGAADAGHGLADGAQAGDQGDDRSRHAAGMVVRRAVLGDEHVDRAISRTTDFTATFQDFITRYAWGEIWTRPGLSRKTRSCVTLTALVARGHHEELAMHVRAALRNGLTPDEIGEVLLQTAVYCGVPAANAAFAVAEKILREERKS
jgi:3-oxoadipate enol-lactonase/4-carboxymuconolactone decarboxylase